VSPSNETIEKSTEKYSLKQLVLAAAVTAAVGFAIKRWHDEQQKKPSDLTEKKSENKVNTTFPDSSKEESEKKDIPTTVQ